MHILTREQAERFEQDNLERIEGASLATKLNVERTIKDYAWKTAYNFSAALASPDYAAKSKGNKSTFIAFEDEGEHIILARSGECILMYPITDGDLEKTTALLDKFVKTYHFQFNPNCQDIIPKAPVVVKKKTTRSKKTEEDVGTLMQKTKKKKKFGDNDLIEQGD